MEQTQNGIREAVSALTSDLQTIQGLTDEIINMLLGGGCHKKEILINSEEILKLTEKIEQELSKL